MKPYINSEILPLRNVLLHRPESSLQRITYNNCHNFLFEDVIWLEKAQEEHDIFSNVLKSNSIKIHYFTELLYEVVENISGRSWLLREVITKKNYGPQLSYDLKNYLLSLSSKTLISYLISGVTVKEIDIVLSGLTGITMDKDDFILPPLPNILFTRDIITVIYNYININSMALAARKLETIYGKAIFLFSSLFQESRPLTIYDDNNDICMPPLEGGDIMVISPTCLFIGLSQRTTPQAIEILATKLLKQHNKNEIRIIVIKIPKARSTMHLDTVMTMINHSTFCVFSEIINENTPCWEINLNYKTKNLNIFSLNNLFRAISDCLGIKKLNIISLPPHSSVSECEQWNDSNNLLAIKPGVVISYDRNVETNKKLKEEGIEVITVPSSELGRGRGGIHCMSAPLRREKI